MAGETNGTVDPQVGGQQQAAPGQATPAPAAAQPAQSAPAAQGPASQGGSSGISGVAGVQAGTPAPAQPQTPQGVRDVLRTMGYDLSGQFQDDHSALAYLAQQARVAQQSAQLAQYGQQYLQHADQFQAFLRQQQAEQQRLAAQQQGWFKAPEFDPSWTQKIYRDQAGNLQVVPGADPMLVSKYVAWTEHQRGWLDKISQDPIGAMRPGLEQLIDQRAQQLIEQRLGGFQEQNAARQFVQQNSSWLHARDQQGQVVIDPRTQMPALSPAGQRFAAYVQEAEQLGLNTQGQTRYALGMVERDVAMARLQSQPQQAAQPAVTPQQQAKDDFLSQAAQRVLTPAQQGTQGNVQGAPPPIQPGARNLREIMMADMAAAGFLPGQQLT